MLSPSSREAMSEVVAPDIRPPHRFEVGTYRCTVLDDGTYDYDASMFVANAQPGELSRAWRDHAVDDGRILSPYTCLLIDTGRQLVLLDTGGAAWHPSVGRLRQSLAAEGIDPHDVDVVVLTHGHPDHIGGNIDEAGMPAYTRATHVIDADEWAFWTQEETLARTPERFRSIARANLGPIAGRLRQTRGEEEVVPGIRVVPSPGHTPGHLAVIVEDGGEELLYISDAALHPVHLEHPGWHPVYDLDPVRAVASRRMLLEHAAQVGCLVHAFHFAPYPCLGHVVATRSGWRWEPISDSARP